MDLCNLRLICLTLFLAVTLPHFGNATPHLCANIFRSNRDTLETAKKMIEASKTKEGLEKDKLFVQEPHYVRIRVGMPSTLRLIPPEGRVFRQYTNRVQFQEILDSNKLVAGATPFYYSGYIVDYNEDLTGIFITDPGVRPSSVGVRPENSECYVDFKLTSDTGILWMRNEIYMIPGVPKIESWKLDIYRGPDRGKYSEYAEQFALWDQQGVPEPVMVDIEIVGSSCR